MKSKGKEGCSGVKTNMKLLSLFFRKIELALIITLYFCLFFVFKVEKNIKYT